MASSAQTYATLKRNHADTVHLSKLKLRIITWRSPIAKEEIPWQKVAHLQQ
jgi:hypothetical protein